VPEGFIRRAVGWMQTSAPSLGAAPKGSSLASNVLGLLFGPARKKGAVTQDEGFQRLRYPAEVRRDRKTMQAVIAEFPGGTCSNAIQKRHGA